MQSKLSMTQLLNDIKKYQFWEDGSKILMCRSQNTGLLPDLTYQFQLLILEIEYNCSLLYKKILKAKHMMVNRLPPGISVPIHTDPFPEGKKYVRFHLPIQTNPKALFWDMSKGHRHFQLGVWSGPVEHWKDHSVCNLGETERIHIVVDLE